VVRLPLPGDLSTVTVTGTFKDAGGAPQLGSVTFTPSANLTDATGEVVVWATPRAYPLSGGTLTAGPLAATDNSGLSPSGWTYAVTVAVQGTMPYTFWARLPSSPSTVNFTALVPESSPGATSPYLLTSGGTMAGPLVIGDGLQIPSGAAGGYVLTSDSAGHAAWEPGGSGGGHFTQGFTALSVVTVVHNLGRNPAVTVIDSAEDVCTGDVHYIDSNTVQLTFSAPFSGTAICT
jgi:hypothetical protein